MKSRIQHISLLIGLGLTLCACGGGGDGSSEPQPTPSPEEFIDIPVQSSITKVQPMTGIVLWADSHNGTPLKTSDEFVQLEFSYLRPSDVVIGDDLYDWTSFESLLEEIRTRGKQAIVRWYYAYPGKTTTGVPAYIKDYADYKETLEQSEGQDTAFPDWSHKELQEAHLDFYTAFAERYDEDPRIAFLQVGFGLWGEYHIYDPEVRLGENFPSKDYQRQFARHLDSVFETLPWSISIDAGFEANSPYSEDAQLRSLEFGLFDDSFMHEEHADYNAEVWSTLEHETRYSHSPHGGELSYYSDYDQQHALDAEGMYGRTYEELSAKFHITYMIGNDQPDYQDNQRIKEAGLANGYRFAIREFKASPSSSRVTIQNTGIAPIYYDAYVAVDGVRASTSLKGLLPEQSIEVEVAAGGENPSLSIESDHILDTQEIQFIADL